MPQGTQKNRFLNHVRGAVASFASTDLKMMLETLYKNIGSQNLTMIVGKEPRIRGRKNHLVPVHTQLGQSSVVS